MVCLTALFMVRPIRIPNSAIGDVPFNHSLIDGQQGYFWVLLLQTANASANSFLNALGECVRAQMQLFLWGQIAKNRMAGLTSNTLNFFLQISLNCLPKKAVS